MLIGTPPALPVAPPPPSGAIYRLSVEKYLEMTRAGILTADDRVELLEGVLVAKIARNPPYILVTKRIFAALAAALPPGWHAAKEDPIRLPDSVPEPDCAVLRGSADDYRDRLPGPADVALVVEVADASLVQDRGDKQRTYARAEIPVYWLANLAAGRFEVYTDPSGPAEVPGYRSCVPYAPGQEFPVVIAGQEVARFAVRDLLP